MGSTFTWLDYSEHERRKSLDLISLFDIQDTRDELGIGTVRDAFADLFFPGTSTIQTRARYFLFVPWIYRALEEKQTPPSEIAASARKREIGLISPLEQSDDKEGIIGIEARESLKRLPSNIYWQGLGIWGIRLFPGSQHQYHRSIQSFFAPRNQAKNDDGEPIQGRRRICWHPELPDPPDSFPEKATFRLRRQEAEYLRDRILSRAPRTLLAWFVENADLTEVVDFPWEYPQFARFPESIKEQLHHARNFSEIIHGAALLYNLMLAEKACHAERKREYREWFAEWAEELITRKKAFASWSRQRFWEIATSHGARIPSPTRFFVETWIDLVLGQESPLALTKDQGARDFVRNRERDLKRDLARLENQSALEQWRGAAGTGRIDFRWSGTQVIIADLLNGLGKGAQDA